MAAADPFYNRKPVPRELIEDVGITGLATQEEHLTRERKYSRDGDDVRKFSNPGQGKDPFYSRKRLSKAMITGIGDTGLSPQEEHLNRERKYSLQDGSDARTFSNTITPRHDPFYGRKKINEKDIRGVGDTGNTPAEDYDARDRKQSMFQLSGDPFSELSGSGHRQSISAASTGASAAATQRRRSSAVAPHEQHHDYHHSDRLETIESRPEEALSNATTHTAQYELPDDPDGVAPDEIR